MNRRSAIVLVIVVALTLAVVGIYELLPKHFERGEHITQVLAFWNQNEAFVFLNLQVTGRATNFIQEKLARSHFGAPFLLLGWNDILYKPEVVAWHLPANGELSRSSLPANTGTSGRRSPVQAFPGGPSEVFPRRASESWSTSWQNKTNHPSSRNNL